MILTLQKDLSLHFAIWQSYNHPGFWAHLVDISSSSSVLLRFAPSLSALLIF